MNVDFSTAAGKKEAYSHGTLPEDDMEIIGDYLHEAGQLWRTGFAATLEGMRGIKSFPQRIYLSGGGAGLPTLKELLYEDVWRKAIPFAGDLEIETASAAIWKDQVVDELDILAGPQMFVPVSLGLIKLEI
jgi:hypothetical protein